MQLSRIVLALLLGLFAINAIADTNPSGAKLFFGAGYVNYTVSKPSSNFKLDSGGYYILGGEKGLGALNLYLNFAFSYLATSGITNYSYTSSAGDAYATTDMKFDTSHAQASLGLKFKIINKFFIRPYIEGGGLLGFYTIEHKPTSAQRADLDADAAAAEYKLKESLIDYGAYGEFGLEIDMFDKWGIKPAYRVQNIDTKEFDTLGRQKLSYSGSIYYFTLFKSF